jgi:hypothetical protein
MNVIIGYWLIIFAIVLFIIFFEPDLTVKEKIIGVICFMVFITILLAGICLVVGGV